MPLKGRKAETTTMSSTLFSALGFDAADGATPEELELIKREFERIKIEAHPIAIHFDLEDTRTALGEIRTAVRYLSKMKDIGDIKSAVASLIGGIVIYKKEEPKMLPPTVIGDVTSSDDTRVAKLTGEAANSLEMPMDEFLGFQAQLARSVPANVVRDKTKRPKRMDEIAYVAEHGIPDVKQDPGYKSLEQKLGDAQRDFAKAQQDLDALKQELEAAKQATATDDQIRASYSKGYWDAIAAVKPVLDGTDKAAEVVIQKGDVGKKVGQLLGVFMKPEDVERVNEILKRLQPKAS